MIKMEIEKAQLEKSARELVRCIGDANLHQDAPSSGGASPANAPSPDIFDGTSTKCHNVIETVHFHDSSKSIRISLVSAVLVLLMTVSVFALPQLISYIRKSEDYGEYTEIRFQGTGTDDSVSKILVKLGYRPSGYILYKSTDTFLWYSDPNGDGEFMVDTEVIHSGPNSVSTLHIDTENAEREDITVNGNKGIILRKRVECDQTDRLQIYWEDPQVGAYFLLSFFEMDEAEAFKILNGFEYKGE